METYANITYNSRMAEIDSALMYEILKALQTGQSQMQTAMRNLTAEVRIANGHVASLVQGEVHSTGRMAELEARMERVERRLDINPGE